MGKGALAPCPPSTRMVGTLRFAHPTTDSTVKHHIRHCERSEAIHVSTRGKMDCFAALAMTTFLGALLHSRGTICPSDASCVAPESRGRRECRVPLHPQPRVQAMRKGTHTSSQQVQPNTLRHPLRNGFRFIRALPGVPGLLASVARRQLTANLTPASGRQDHAISPSASRTARLAAATRPSHPAPRS